MRINNRFLAINALKKVFCEAIPRLDSLENCDKLEYELLRARKGGLIDDKSCVEMLAAIQEMRKLYT